METFPYQIYASDPTCGDPSEFYWRPMLLVSIFGTSGRLDTIGLADTGAIETVIPRDYWDEVKPVFIEGEEGVIEAANGTEIATKYGTVDLATRIGDAVYRWSAKLGFSDERDELVLGDLGFLRHFKVDFDRAAKRLTAHDPVDLPPSFVTMIATGDLPRSSQDVRSRMKARGERPRPRRRPHRRGG